MSAGQSGKGCYKDLFPMKNFPAENSWEQRISEMYVYHTIETTTNGATTK